ncbi:hypothetical protein B0H13DRAFT_2667579 [Mycena leptocephala]|nr:hypothetical protein B0H13DRAFT_2667579 [Mycena leptocephala]
MSLASYHDLPASRLPLPSPAAASAHLVHARRPFPRSSSNLLGHLAPKVSSSPWRGSCAVGNIVVIWLSYAHNTFPPTVSHAVRFPPPPPFNIHVKTGFDFSGDSTAIFSTIYPPPTLILFTDIQCSACPPHPSQDALLTRRFMSMQFHGYRLACDLGYRGFVAPHSMFRSRVPLGSNVEGRWMDRRDGDL